MIQMFFALFLIANPAPDEVEYATEWTVTVAENDIERSMRAVDPQDLKFSFPVDQALAPGWTCEVLPEVWRGNNRSRWLTCAFREGRAKVSIRTNCRSNRSNTWSQELWLGDRLSVSLACRSGVLP
jgi:hypothetical protein